MLKSWTKVIPKWEVLSAFAVLTPCFRAKPQLRLKATFESVHRQPEACRFVTAQLQLQLLSGHRASFGWKSESRPLMPETGKNERRRQKLRILSWLSWIGRSAEFGTIGVLYGTIMYYHYHITIKMVRPWKYLVGRLSCHGGEYFMRAPFLGLYNMFDAGPWGISRVRKAELPLWHGGAAKQVFHRIQTEPWAQPTWFG